MLKYLKKNIKWSLRSFCMNIHIYIYIFMKYLKKNIKILIPTAPSFSARAYIWCFNLQQHSFNLRAATRFENLQQLLQICSNFIQFAATLFCLQQDFFEFAATLFYLQQVFSFAACLLWATERIKRCNNLGVSLQFNAICNLQSALYNDRTDIHVGWVSVSLFLTEERGRGGRGSLSTCSLNYENSLMPAYLWPGWPGWRGFCESDMTKLKYSQFRILGIFT